MDGGIASSSPESLRGILKTIFLFLENQNFTETCGTLIKESQSKHIPHVKEAPARLVVLRPSITETVRIAHVDPKRPDTDGQVQADFPLPFTDRSCILEGSVYAMPETHPSSKYVSLFIIDRDDYKALESGKLRVASAPNLGIKECHCSREKLNESVRETPTEREAVEGTVKDDSVKSLTEDDLFGKPTEEDLVKRPTEDDLFEKPTEDDLFEKPTEDDLFEKPTEEEGLSDDDLFEKPIEDDLFEEPAENDLLVFERPITKDDLVTRSTDEDIFENELIEKSNKGSTEIGRPAQIALVTEDNICHVDCIGLCTHEDSTECVILKQSGEYYFIQRSCPFSCTGACSEGNLIQIHTEDKHGEAESPAKISEENIVASREESAERAEISQQSTQRSADEVQIKVIHQRSGEIAKAITSLCSAECSCEEMKRSLQQVISACPYKVTTRSSGKQQGSKEIDPGDSRQSSVKSARRLSSKSIDSDKRKSSTEKELVQRRQNSAQSAEKMPLENQLHSSTESTILQQTTDEVKRSSSQELEEESSKRSVQKGPSQEAAPPLQSIEEEEKLGSKTSEVHPAPVSTYEEYQHEDVPYEDENELGSIKENVSGASQKLVESEEVIEEPSKPEELSISVKETSLKSAPSQVVELEEEIVCISAPTGRKPEFFHLDYVKLKKHFREGDPDSNRRILQALRWRLTSSKPETRNNIMVGYTKNDVLGLREKNRSVAEEILCPAKETAPDQLQEGMARFINAMASLTLGREYLCQKEHFLARVLIPLLLQDDPKCPLSDATRCHLLVTLQKLSLRNNMRKIMISAGLPEYIMPYLLDKHKGISQYCLEYTTALFMNLCLHKEARDQLKLTPGKVIDLIMAFLDSDHDECLPYMNGAMYSIFIEPTIRIEAINRKLDEKIEEKINRSKSEDLRRQTKIIQNILKLHPSETYCTECDCLDQDEEVDHLEAELDARDDMSDPKGESVLEQFRKPERCKVLNLECLRRPVTPLQKIAFDDPCKNCKSSADPDEQHEEVVQEKKIIEPLSNYRTFIELSKKSSIETADAVHKFEMVDERIEDDEEQVVQKKRTPEKTVEPRPKKSSTEIVDVLCKSEKDDERIEDGEGRVVQKKKTSEKTVSRKKASTKTVDTLYKSDKAEQQESKTDAELEYLLAAKAALNAKQTKTSRRNSSRGSTTSKSRSRSHLNTSELNSVYFQQRHYRDDSLNLPSSYTRPIINAQDRTSFRADQTKACSFSRPYVFYKNYKVCYRNDLSSPHFPTCTAQMCHGHQAQNRYKCDCYEEMKTLIDQLGSEEQRCGGFTPCRRKPNLSSALIKLETQETPVANVQPSYNELLHSLRRNLCVTDYCTSETKCTVHCECYNLVFQSRPKVTRTP